MALKIFDRFPGANVRVLGIHTTNDTATEVVFTPDPKGGTEALWFDFRLHDPSPPTTGAPESVTLTLRFFETLLGGNDPSAILPVVHEPGKNWIRLKAPEVHTGSDGQSALSWSIPYPINPTEFAFCLPYGSDELKTTLKHCKGYWQETDIGPTQGGRMLGRMSNNIQKGCDACPNPHGLYILARQHAGETPGSWVMDGMLEAFSRAKPVNWCVWAVPFANLDDVIRGAYGKDPFPYDLNRAWGDPPMRHETLVLRHDMHRWARRCNPELVIDLHAPGACEQAGVYAFVAKSENPEWEKNNQAWLNIFRHALMPEYAAEDFSRRADYASRWETPRVSNFVEAAIGCSALSLETPYGHIAGTILLQKQYREIGQRLARAILSRWGKAAANA